MAEPGAAIDRQAILILRRQVRFQDGRPSAPWPVSGSDSGSSATWFTANSQRTLPLLAFALGLIGFSALALAWHWLRIRRNPAPFRDANPLGFALSVVISKATSTPSTSTLGRSGKMIRGYLEVLENASKREKMFNL